jgi:hypothetical protein
MPAPICKTVCGDTPGAAATGDAAQLLRLTPQTIPGGFVPTDIDFTEVGFQFGSAVPSTETDDIVVGEGGLYEITYNIVWAPNGDASLVLSSLTKNGVVPSATAEFDPAAAFVQISAAEPATANGKSMAVLAVGDRIGLNAANDSATARAILFASLSLVRLI